MLEGNNDLKEYEIAEGGVTSNIRIKDQVCIGTIGIVLGFEGLDLSINSTHYSKKYKTQKDSDIMSGATIYWKY
ncbi:MAG: hypothetical protein ACJA02_001119 [Myxococcota bacterium]